MFLWHLMLPHKLPPWFQQSPSSILLLMAPHPLQKVSFASHANNDTKFTLLAYSQERTSGNKHLICLVSEMFKEGWPSPQPSNIWAYPTRLSIFPGSLVLQANPSSFLLSESSAHMQVEYDLIFWPNQIVIFYFFTTEADPFLRIILKLYNKYIRILTLSPLLLPFTIFIIIMATIICFEFTFLKYNF